MTTFVALKRNCQFLITVLLVGNLLAADAIGGSLGIGIKFGLNAAKFVGSDARDAQHNLPATIRTGFVGGAFVNVSVNRTLSIQPELLYSMKGTTYKQGVEKVTYELNYLELPLLLKYTFDTPTDVKVHLVAGPAFAWRLNVKVMYENDIGSSELAFDKSELKSTDLGLAFGVGLGFKAGKGTVTLDGRYTLGLRSIDATTAADPVESDVKNGTFSLMLGYSL